MSSEQLARLGRLGQASLSSRSYPGDDLPCRLADSQCNDPKIVKHCRTTCQQPWDLELNGIISEAMRRANVLSAASASLNCRYRSTLRLQRTLGLIRADPDAGILRTYYYHI